LYTPFFTVDVLFARGGSAPRFIRLVAFIYTVPFLRNLIDLPAEGKIFPNFEVHIPLFLPFAALPQV
jgi:hypothetical protein